VDNLNGTKLGNKNITCCRAQKRFERENRLKREWEQQKFNKYHGINLYVKHIEDEVDEEMLRKEFAVYGEIRSCKIATDAQGNSKGFGFVCFSSPEEAQKAIMGLNSKMLPGQKKPLFVALHESKEARKQKLSHRHNLSITKGVRGLQQQVYPTPQGAQPMFYPSGSPGFIYPQQVMPMQQRGWSAAPSQFQQMAPNNFVSGLVGQRPGARGGASAQGNVSGNVGGSIGSTGANRDVSASGRAQQQQQQRTNNRQQQGIRRGQQQPIVGQMDGSIELTMAQLSQFPQEQQKLLLGERLYPLIVPSQGNLAGKITGMFLDSGWSTEELLSLIHDDNKLQQKIQNAIEVLQRAQEEQ